VSFHAVRAAPSPAARSQAADAPTALVPGTPLLAPTGLPAAGQCLDAARYAAIAGTTEALASALVPGPANDGPGCGALDLTDIVVVDVETTGWLPEEAVLTEVGAVRLSGGRIAAEFSALVNPGVPIPAGVAELTGITDGMVADAPGAGQVLTDFLDFASGSVLAAHNAPFDVAFLKTACQRNGLPWSPPAVIDTAVLARLVLRPDQVPDRKLATLASYFGTTATPCHRALADARATAEVLSGLVNVLGDRATVAALPRAAIRRRLAAARRAAGRLARSAAGRLARSAAGRLARQAGWLTRRG
jgi:DNA polymerase III epsilon subunit family exonuclease